MKASNVGFVSSLRTGSGLTALAVASLMASPAIAQTASGQPVSTSPNNTTSQTPTSPELQTPAPGKGANRRVTTTDQKGEQAIVITGTVSRQTQTASPVTVVSASNLQDRGITTVAEAVQQLSANNAGADPASWTTFGFATGASAPSLRGFNDAYTITLFDGLRSAVYPLADDGYRNFVDINTIPESIVDRIEVLQDGASANYGADAIAGVVNVIIKKQVTGIHVNGSYGISEHGDAGEKRFDATVGYGSLADQGFNIYLNGEYQKDDPLWMRDRGYPYDTADLSKICGIGSLSGANVCGLNGIRNGIQWNGVYRGFQSTTTAFGRPFTPAAVAAAQAGGSLVSSGPYQLLDAAGGCQGLTPYTLSASQQTASAPSTVCQQDLVNQYRMYDPEITRKGLNLHATVNITPDIEAYVMANWYDVQTMSASTPESFTGSTAAGGTQETIGGIFLPVYVCPTAQPVVGAGGLVTFTGCNAANGTLNPNNPFAAQGNLALLSALYNQPITTLTDANTYRLSGGVSGTFRGFNFNVEGTTSRVDLDVTNENVIFLKNLLYAVGTGGYNFANQNLNTAAQDQLVAPTHVNHSTSKLSQIQATIGRDLLPLPGGDVNLAVGVSWRQESLNNPSANPPNEVDPFARYYGGINSVGAIGSRTVLAGYYSLDVPAFTGFDFKAEGRYDKYSSGQKAFSPKFELQYRPADAIKLRGTYSRGFRVPSFNEAYGLPTTGYVTGNVSCPPGSPGQYPNFCAAHSNNPAYTGSYVYGLTSVGNPGLAPEHSTSWTAGTVITPTRRLTFTVDYWYTRIKGIIIPAVASQSLIDQYYNCTAPCTTPGATHVGAFTLVPGTPDPSNPTALPLLGFVQASYANADSEVGSGVDLSATARLPLNNSGLRLISSLNASYLAKLTLTDPSTGPQVYAGTLSPCNITSCSGAPRWRGNWQNTLDFNGRASLTATVYYTSGYSEISTDYGGIVGDCDASTGGMSELYYPDGSPMSCRTKATWDVDLTGQIKLSNHLTLYGNVLNILNIRPPFDPNAGYGLYQFNPAWADRNFIGRYFRIGVKLDL